MEARRPILIHSYAGAFGGSEAILLDLLRRSQLNLLLATTSTTLADAAQASGITVIRMRDRPFVTRGPLDAARALIHLLAYGRDVSRLVDELDPAMTVAWNMRSAIGGAVAGSAASRPSAVEHVDFLPRGLRGRLARWAILRNERVVTLSAAIARDLNPAWTADGRLSVVHPGVELMSPVDELPSDVTRVLVLAALEPWKAQDLALEAAATVESVELVLAGDPIDPENDAFRQSLVARANREDLKGRVSFPGRVDAKEAIKVATALLHPTPREPFGRVIVEAMAAGRPVIAVDDGGPAEILDQGCGFLVPAGKPGEISSALRDITDDPVLAREMGRAGRRRAAEMFDPRQQARSWDRSISSVLHDAPPDGPAKPPGSELSLVTVIHESASDLARLLRSVSRHLPGVEMIVVDSGSTDGGAAMAEQWRPDVKVLELNGNEGFSAGCVAGVVLATRPFTCLINPDVELVDDSLDRLVESLLENADEPKRIVAPALVHPDGRLQDSVHPLPGAMQGLVRSIVPATLLPRALAQKLEPHRARHPRAVGWAVGACLVAHTETFRELGPFDPSVHLYAEDLDLCLRASELGVETWFDPRARVVHREAHSSRVVFGGEPYDLLARRRRTVIRERLGNTALLRDDISGLVTNCNRIALKSLIGRPSAAERARLAALISEIRSK